MMKITSIILYVFLLIGIANTRLYSQTDQFQQSDINGEWGINVDIINNAVAHCFVCPKILFDKGMGTIDFNGSISHFTWEFQNNLLMVDCLDKDCKRYFQGNTGFHVDLRFENEDKLIVLKLNSIRNNEKINFGLVMRRRKD